MACGGGRTAAVLAAANVLAVLALLVSSLVSTARTAPAAPFITLEQHAGAWWFVDGDGRRFLSVGVNYVDRGVTAAGWSETNPSYSAHRAYPDALAWERHALQRLASWGFNTLGAWSAEDLYANARVPFTVCLHVGASLGVPWVDLWAPDAEQSLDVIAQQETARWRDDRHLIGYFYDNELAWWDETLFQYFMALPFGDWVDEGGARRWVPNGAKERLVALFEREYGSAPARLREDWVLPPGVNTVTDLRGPVEIKRRLGRRPAVLDAFMDAMYERYEQLVTAAIRRADPNHLLLGSRYPQVYSARHVAAAGKTSDVLSTNLGAWVMDGWVSPNWLSSISRIGGRPVLVSEFYFSARENTSLNRNSRGGFPVVHTQRERAAGYAAQVRQMASLPAVVGWHWFQYYDEPRHGRGGDGEDFNMGLVDVENREYQHLVEAASAANRDAVRVHELAGGSAGRPASPSSAFPVPAVGRPPVLDGDLRDWRKTESWLPGVSGQPFGAPLGDLFVSATPGHLHLAAMYQPVYRDAGFVEPLRVGEDWPEEECERASVIVRSAAGTPVAKVLLRRDPESRGWIIRQDTTGAAAQGSRAGAFELSIPVTDMRTLSLEVEIRSRADAQVISWGRREVGQGAGGPDGLLLLPSTPGSR